VNNTNIDWDGNCEFDANGKVVRFLRESLSNSYSMRPIPKTEAVMVDARNASKMLDSVMQPVTRDQIVIAIKKLSLHCGMQAKSPEDVKFMMTDYCQDLTEYPVSLINEACETYRKLPDGNSFMPSSGKLISLMSHKYQKMKFLRTRIDKILGKYEATPQRGNKSVSLMDAIESL